MRKKYGERGLVTISVSLDPPEEKDVVEEARQFLKRQNATMANYLLTDDPEVWQEELKSLGPPIVYVFNREGKIAEKFADGREAKPEELDKVVEQLLRQKREDRE